MALNYEYVKERIRILEEAYAVLQRFPKQSLELLKEILVQKHILKNPSCLYKQNFHEIATKNISNTESFREVASLARRMQGRVVEGPKNVICPITKKEIVEFFYGPCGHPMERVAAEMLCRSNPRPKCPHLGCNKIIKMKLEST